MSDRPFEGRVALVTGGGRGMGRSHCLGFANRGAAVVVTDIQSALVDRVVGEIEAIGGNALGLVVDVGDEQSVRSAYARVTEKFGRVDFLVNNAAIMLDLEEPFKPFWMTSCEEWNRVMMVNVGGTFLMCKHAKPIMERLGSGRIVNIGSDAVWKGYEGQLAYFASKGAVTVMTRNLAREFGPFNVTVNCVAPGYTLSEVVVESPEMNSVAHLIRASCCIKRDQHPADVTGAVLFLCGAESSCITGQSLVVNCGSIMP